LKNLKIKSESEKRQFGSDTRRTGGQRRTIRFGCLVHRFERRGKNNFGVERQLWNRGGRTFLLDGDTLRANLCSDLGFSADDRRENIRRAGIVARLMAEAGLICLTALISPFRVDRLRARNEMPAGSFVEVFVNAPLEVCEQRDLKGLYQRARSGELADFTGISSPYEPPESPEVEIRSDLLTVEASTALVLKALEQRKGRLLNFPGEWGRTRRRKN
jgi:adenylylsulfate kinase